jgi:Amt family ammonium transporter
MKRALLPTLTIAIVIACGTRAMAAPALTLMSALVAQEEAAAPPAEPVAIPAAEPDSIAALNANSSALRIGLDTVWVLICGMLVFWMNAGFALVESGLCQAKNCTNILAKNFVVFAIATLSFWAIGWGLMFGDGAEPGTSDPYVGKQGILFLSGEDNSPALGSAYASMNPFSTDEYKGDYSAINWTPIPLFAKFFFQLVFAGTAATIVSGAVAERIKFLPFLLFSFLLVAFIYPISGHWIWGGGFLGANNFRDFAGCTTVHSVGGWAALAGILVLGPRLGKFRPDGSVKPIPGHSLTSASLGVFILWLGWFGFNPGSTMSAGNGAAIAHVIAATNLGACTGTIGALLTAWLMLGKPDLSMILNGCLAGLVAVTAPCAFITLESSAIVGLIGGVLAVLGVLAFDKMKIDDPVGALSVHLLNGVFGTLAVALFYDYDVATNIAALPPTNAEGVIPADQWSKMDQLMVQLKGVGAVAVYVFSLSMVIWVALKAMGGIRVTPEEEIEGLDVGEHGNECYPNFVGKQTVSFSTSEV